MPPHHPPIVGGNCPRCGEFDFDLSLRVVEDQITGSNGSVVGLGARTETRLAAQTCEALGLQLSSFFCRSNLGSRWLGRRPEFRPISQWFTTDRFGACA